MGTRQVSWGKNEYPSSIIGGYPLSIIGKNKNKNFEQALMLAEALLATGFYRI